MGKITLLLVDDHTVVRQGLRALLALHTDFDVIGEAANGHEAVASVARLKPDVVLMDVAMPLLNGRQATRQLLKVAPATRVLVLSSYSDEECVTEMLAAGATGYLLKQAMAEELAQAIRAARRGLRVLSPAIAKYGKKRYGSGLTDGHPTGLERLTAREIQVLQLIGKGFSNREMAGKLSISIKTVEKHRQKVMDKLDIHEVAGLTRFILSHPLEEPRQPLAA